MALDVPAVVLDYAMDLTGIQGGFVFTNGHTIRVVGVATLNGTTTFEGGTIVKFKQSGPGPNTKLVLNGPVLCKTSPYLPAVMTGDEDDSVGEFVYPRDAQNPFIDPTGRYYAATALVINSVDTTLQHLRIAHAQEAIRYEASFATNYYGETLRHVQIVDCQQGITALGVNYYGTTYWRTLNAGNLLMSNVDKGISGRYYRGTVEHLTISQCDYLAEGYTGVSYYSTLTFRNSIFANIGALYGPAGSTLDLGACAYNGFWEVAPQHRFGSAQRLATADPFQGVAQGAHYLRADSDLRAQGTTGINPTLLNDLKQRTTQAPVVFVYPTAITTDTTWAPQVPRYATGNPDLGHYYAPLDYLVTGVEIWGASLQIRPGTAVGVWLKDLGDYPPGWGLLVEAGGGLSCVGGPTRLNRFVTADLVQEAYNPDAPALVGMPYGGVASVSVDAWGSGDPPHAILECAFTDFAALSRWRRYHLIVGEDCYEGYPWTYGNYISIVLRDCQFHGGRFILSQFGVLTSGTVRLQNNLFERVESYLHQEWAAWLEAYNLFFAPNCR